MEKIPINDSGEGNCCPVCNSKRITRHEQRNLQVAVNLSTEKAFCMKKGRMQRLTNSDKARAFDQADCANGGGCWSFECRVCGWQSDIFVE
ncbi:hypothetical protein AALA78_03295 [Lachnospiraceae bacterium 42-17]|jgi:hypothetical protein